ncbi:hypothetical protein NDU88_002430 [Pleurodeles waltl]|uniref:MHC class I antigen n=1 Tax=Pleurodeles waltl TaxID=8319 RepID=A0AAV7PBM0_PLEWA|nr:hypothetical protein NDU88_002430 [Pleurodeles waltl]
MPLVPLTTGTRLCLSWHFYGKHGRAVAGYEGESGKVTFYDDSVGSFEHDLVYACDAGVRHTVNAALAQAIQTIKHHLFGFAEQQGWVPQSSSQE